MFQCNVRRAAFAASVSIAGLAGCMLEPDLSAPAVDSVDLARYAGKWYEVASIPSIASAFGRCTNTTAVYTVQSDGTVRLFNECFVDSADGDALSISGRARALDETNARLGILFDGWFFEAEYNIIDLDPDYQWAVVGSGDSGLFILSRTPVLSAETYDGILSRLPLLGYDPDRLLPTPQFTE